MTTTAKVRIETVELATLVRIGPNPNSMSEHDYAALKANIADNGIGYLQPILVAEDASDKNKRVLVDGEHRVKALLECGYTHAEVVVGPLDRARFLRLSMNLHGDPVMSQVAVEIQALIDGGADLAWLGERTPFEEQLLQDLQAQASSALDLDLDVSAKKSPTDLAPDVAELENGEGSPPLLDESTFNLTLRFSSKLDRDRVSQVLRQHGVTPEDGALTLLGLKLQ